MKVLQFSGGVDSLACLHLLQSEPGLCVLTVSTDGAYPERHEYLSRVEKEFFHLKFHRVNTDRQIQIYGHPVDVLPMRYSAVGMMVAGDHGPVRYQDLFSCCRRAIWEPLDRVSRQLGATTIIRGQRASDTMRSPVRNGEVVGGITYEFPIEGWSRDDVLKYVCEHVEHLVPESYSAGERTSRDCMDCTAYLHDNLNRIQNLPRGKRAEVEQVLNQWRDDVSFEVRY
jgi:phosphoadenosine phosphosulfate reductase